jgi:dCTP deaminase
MVLSNVEIQRALDEGRLIIDPEPLPRVPTADNPDCPYDTTSVDLRLGNKLSFPKKGPYTYDLSRKGIAQFLKENCDHKIIDPTGGFTLEPNCFVLGETLERLALPILPDRTLAARIEGKSSFARCGLLIHFTAPTVHADFNGTLTFEMIILGNSPIVLKPGMRICQLILEEVKGTPFPNPSQFQGQTTPTGTRS